MSDGDTVVGVRVRGPKGEETILGQVVLTTGAHDWSQELSAKFTGIPPEDGGSVAPGTLSGDAIALVEPVGGAPDSLPAWAAPVLPGYRLENPAFDGDTGFRACYEHCLPHTFLVNERAERFFLTGVASASAGGCGSIGASMTGAFAFGKGRTSATVLAVEDMGLSLKID